MFPKSFEDQIGPSSSPENLGKNIEAVYHFSEQSINKMINDQRKSELQYIKNRL